MIYDHTQTFISSATGCKPQQAKRRYNNIDQPPKAIKHLANFH
jgi:hypothetical protein